MSRKLRLVKVIVQPVFVVDDGENLAEVAHPAVTVPAEEWSDYSDRRFPRELVRWQEKLDKGEPR